MQAQDLRSARLAVRARTEGLTAADVDRALDERTLVVGWLNRGTLHLVRNEDYWWLHALTTPPLFTANARRLAQTGVTPDAAERGVAAIERALTDEGPLTRDELRDRVRAAGVETAGQALVHLLMLACLRGIAVRGPFRGRQHAYVLAHDWLGAASSGRAGACARRAGAPVPRGPRAGGRSRSREVGGTAASRRTRRSGRDRDRKSASATGLLELKGTRRGGSPRACLLDQWDPLLVGWRSRESLLDRYPRRDSAEAHFRPFAYVRARAVATWSLRSGVVTIDEPFARVSRAENRALAADAADVARFLSG